jgi:ribosomal-protein-alanine N-acetyltransferase
MATPRAALAPSPETEASGALRWQPQPFDSEHLGAPVARLTVAEEGRGGALESALPGLLATWRERRIWLLSCRLPAQWSAEGRLLEAAGFRAIETLVTYGRPLDPLPPSPRPATLAGEADAEACIDIGRRAFRFDRYHADPEIDDRGADALKAAWVRNALAGRAEATLVVREEGRARGFVLCLLRDTTAVIDLIAVAPEHHGRGHGRALVAGALRHFADQAHTMQVSTQVANHVSTVLYERLGFRVVGRARTYHRIEPGARP